MTGKNFNFIGMDFYFVGMKKLSCWYGINRFCRKKDDSPCHVDENN